ncbi:MAG: DUF479 domain-containing protein [Taibaiella sp.]|nr:DUF479 domain-containing protein [Taibaiella sp.]
MNYLGHALLGMNDAELITGNLIADHVKGRLALEQYPEGIRKGILLHRKIDSYTDTHPASQRAKLWFRQDYRLYAGPIVDCLYDHFLANDPKYFASEKALLAFTEDVYEKAAANEKYFPPAFAQYFQHMRQYNWLYNYRSMGGMKKSLEGLGRRAKLMPPTDMAYTTFIGHYYQLAQCYYEFMDDVYNFVKIELTEI